MKFVSALACFIGLVGCTAETSAVDHHDSTEDTKDAAVSGDRTFESCMAACSNASFSCNVGGVSSLEAYLSIEATGCRGQLENRVLLLDCHERRVCVDETCQSGTFSAMTFAWEKTVCTRN